MRAALIARQFDVQGRLVTVEPYGSGNVNDTYLAVFRTTFSEQRFIVQRIRKAVFPNPEVIMQNMRVLTDHCHAKLEAEAEGADRIWQLPKIIQTKAGEDWVTDADGDLWVHPATLFWVLLHSCVTALMARHRSVPKRSLPYHGCISSRQAFLLLPTSASASTNGLSTLSVLESTD